MTVYMQNTHVMHYCFNVSFRQIQTLLLAPYQSQANCIKATANKVIKFNMNLVFCVIQSIFHVLE